MKAERTDEIASAIMEAVNAMMSEGLRLPLIAIDGRCAAGKTTLAARMAQLYGCGVIHMDSFFLRKEQRTVERAGEPGGNVDRERFAKEALVPLCAGKPFAYRPYDCARQALAAPVYVEPVYPFIIEGSYSCHPALRDSYALRVFLSIGAREQMERIRRRNGEEGAMRFRDIWIPLEEKYFAAFDVEQACDMHFTL